VDLFGILDSPYVWTATEQDEDGETRINGGSLVELMQANDSSYPHEFDDNQTDEDFFLPQVNPNLDDRCAIFPPSRHSRAEEEEEEEAEAGAVEEEACIRILKIVAIILTE
jgi:hypothetical protein